jgi:hypothetical protein
MDEPERDYPLALAKAVEAASMAYNEGDSTPEKVAISKATAKALYEHIFQNPADYWALDEHYRVAADLAHHWVRVEEQHSSEKISEYYGLIQDARPEPNLKKKTGDL